MGRKLTTDKFIEKAISVHQDKYDYSLVDYKNNKTKVKIICPKHGAFEQAPHSHLQGKGCPKCSINKQLSTTEQFIEKAISVHQNTYDYSLVDYKDAHTKVKIICPIHGVFEQIANSHLQGSGCPKCAGKYKPNEYPFIEKAISVHGPKYDYSLVDYKDAHTKVKIICPDHGAFEQAPNHHLQGRGCPKCAGQYKPNEYPFIEKAISVHGLKYDYSLIDYKDAHTKVKIICPDHGAFEQTPINHLQGHGCPKCTGVYKPTTEEFIEKAISVHQDKYDYSFVDYKNTSTKVKIICPVHGTFEQIANSHLQGSGCPKCAGNDKYLLYADRLLGVDCRRNKDDNNILEVKCMYCNRWYIPSLVSIQSKIQAINGTSKGECNLYCSDECKHACPTYGQILYPKGHKISTSREVQPELRKLVLLRDNYTCQKCNAKDKELHCHHYEGIEVNPVESADIDNCITLCVDCHHEVHTKDKCGIKQYKRDVCGNDLKG